MKKYLNLASVAFLALIVVLIYFTNLSGNFWLTGWDSLHPEFNLGLDFKRALFSSWEEFQGLGMPVGNSQVTEILRLPLLYLLSFIFPLVTIRKIYVVLMLFLGALGVYFFLKKSLFENQEDSSKSLFSLFGSLFYLLNIATVQIFYVPYESFIAFYAFFPWMIFSIFYFLERRNKKSFIFLVLVHLLSSPSFFIPTNFIVYLLSVTVVVSFYLRATLIKRLKSFVFLLLTIVIINSYWLLPFGYNALSNIHSQANAYINLKYSENMFLKSKVSGSIENTALLKGYLLNFTDFTDKGTYGYMMPVWREYVANPLINLLEYVLFAMVVVGLISSIRKKSHLPFVVLFLILFTLMTTETPPFSLVNSLLNHLPLYAQVFRNPFTKFANVLLFVYALFFALGVEQLARFIKNRLLTIGLFTIIFVLLNTSVFPIWKGYFIYPQLRVRIPEGYFQVFKFFQNKGDSRIANFPQFTADGWINYDWGYRGSGFLWYGIEQPILDRAFDVWNGKNENYYWEVSDAVYSKNLLLLENILEKYQINWFLLDENVINPPSPKSLYFDELETMLSATEKIKLAQTFGKIKIYKVDLGTPVKNFVFLAQNLQMVEPEYKWNDFDQAYMDNGHYLSTQPSVSNLQSQVYYPFRSLFTGRNQTDLEFTVKENGDYFLFQKTVPDYLKYHILEIPDFNSKEFIWVDPHNLSNVRYFSPEVSRLDNQVEIKIPEVGGLYGTEINPTEPIPQPKNCNQFTKGQVKTEIIDKFLRQTSVDATSCNVFFSLPNLPHNLGYLITIESRNLSGKSLLFWLENSNSRKPDIETYLPQGQRLVTSYFIRSPMEKDGLGYTLHFDNSSIGSQSSVNDLGRITVNPIPLSFLRQLKLINQKSKEFIWKTFPMENLNHPNPSFYRVSLPANLDKEPSLTLVLSQSFDPGWQAYNINSKLKTQNSKLLFFLVPILGKKINNHVLVNNWENGWILKPGEGGTIILLFWPQYLEFLGFILLGGFMVVFFVYHRQTHTS